MDGKVIWLTWEDHRRSRELARAFDAKYIPLVINKNRYIRYPALTLLTIWNLICLRPKKVFCQNPSIVLTSVLIFLRPLFRYKLIVDRHSNFKFEHEQSKHIKWRIFWLLSRFTVRHSDLTIVTNEPLRKICEKWGGQACVLPDKLPDMSVSNREPCNKFNEKHEAAVNVMCVTTFGGDEPIDEIIESANLLGEAFQLYLTGRFQKYVKSKGDDFKLPRNVLLTGFISEHEYRVLLNSVDVVVVLTTKNLILNCGAYESVSANKPLVLSNTETLRSYFNPGAIFVNIDSSSIAFGVQEAWNKRKVLSKELGYLRDSLEKSWSLQFDEVRRLSQ